MQLQKKIHQNFYFKALEGYTHSSDEQTQLVVFDYRSRKLIYCIIYLYTYTYVCIHTLKKSS